MPPIRLACVQYLNTIPLIEGMARLANVSLVPMIPSLIAGVVARGEADIGLCSVVDAAQVGLAALPVGMIASDGPTMTVRVFSRVPLDAVRTLACDVESKTSVVLAHLLINERSGRTLNTMAWKPGDDWTRAPDAVLLIGDKVVLSAPPRDAFPHSLDLGEAWKARTGMPLVYAMWACKPQRAHDPDIRLACDLLTRQRLHNDTRRALIARTHGPRRGWPADIAERYLCELLRYAPTQTHLHAIERFLGDAHRAGLLPSLRFQPGTPHEEPAGT